MRYLVLGLALLSSLAAHAELATPVEAIELAMAKPLKYVGLYKSPGSETGTMKSCLFRNADVTVVYEYCRKVEAPAVSIRIFVKESKSSVNIYAEGGLDPSTIRRDAYFDPLWRVRAAFNLPSFKHEMTPAKMRNYEIETKNQIGCSVFFMQNMGLFERCFENSGMDEASTAAWIEKTSAFWHEPTESWYEFQKLMRSKVEAAL
jgi:hypothetical protein